ncbi:MAG: hypothetical protein KJ871_15845 [Alphaproteobacteria bacterium]|nr:hypothetical protein [Alphaproteobacteria bacterium]MBU2083774.1 hypothetical protein [Alphaproteobacteria bacterium]MBU2142559.1 hypothetical protein [Alphaproteobacteria bacterium]MBU2197687.1 hypothetical protein [Alphaproteobacteria bacterium]MBU2272548.1 hypothetical protein [Alphaproteobacteria bacterium]
MQPDKFADLSFHPYVRGFWTDEEMFAATGATSLALTKGMQREKLISPGKYKNQNGKLSRAWGATDLFRIALAVDLAHETGFNQLVSIKILGALGTDKIDQVLCTQKTLLDIGSRFNDACLADERFETNGLPVGWSDLEFITDRSEVLDLQIVDRELVFELTQSELDSDKLDMKPLGVLVDPVGNSPKLILTEEDKRPTFFEDERSVLIVRLNCLADRPLRTAFGITAHPNAWVR